MSADDRSVCFGTRSKGVKVFGGSLFPVFWLLLRGRRRDQGQRIQRIG
jgi:hypothetical protein